MRSPLTLSMPAMSRRCFRPAFAVVFQLLDDHVFGRREIGFQISDRAGPDDAREPAAVEGRSGRDHNVYFEARSGVNNVELAEIRDGFADGVLVDIEIGRRETLTEGSHVAQSKLRHDIYVVREAWFTVINGGHRPGYEIRHPQSLQHCYKVTQ